MLFEVYCQSPICPYGAESEKIVFLIRAKELPQYTHVALGLFDEKWKKIWAQNAETVSSVRYGGSPLQEDRYYTVEAVLYDGERAVARAETSISTIFYPKRAQWVGYPRHSVRVLEFRKEFYISDRVVRASLFVCGLGYFTAKIGDEKLGDTYFEPIVTDYGKRDLSKNPEIQIGARQTVCPLVYDITKRLQNGRNTLTVLVGNGYYQNEDKPEEPYFSFGEKKLIFECRIRYASGKEETVYSDQTALVRELPLRSDLYKGDRIDFSEAPGAYEPCILSPPPGGEFVFPPIRSDIVEREIFPVGSKKLENGTLYDFGINHSGGLAFRAKGRRGSKITVRYAEVLYADGKPNFETGEWKEVNAQGKILNSIRQESEFILSGGEDSIGPLFSWHCYRYAQIESEPGTEITGLRSLFLHTETQESGVFDSVPLLKHIERSSVLTMLDNMHSGLLTDCPHREKRPYTGDGRAIAESLLYAFDGEALLGKWLDDILAAQDETGCVPYTAPHFGGGGGFAWGAAIADIPFRLYEYTGDKAYLQKSYTGICKWIAYCGRYVEEGIIRNNGKKWCLGDWMTPGITKFSIPFMSTVSYYQSVSLAERMAEILGYETVSLSALKQQIAAAINARFFHEAEVRYCSGVQGENVWPLALGIVPPQYRQALCGRIRRGYEENGFRIDTGFLTTPVLFETLFTNGMEDVAYKLLMQREYPSYGYMLDGETTLSENWAKKWPDYSFCEKGSIVKGGGELSHCHPMYGSIVAILYKYVAGLNLSALHKKEILFSPKLLLYMNMASASKMTPFGYASVQWERKEKLRMKVIIPKGLSGRFVFPYETEKEKLFVEETGQPVAPSGKQGSFRLPAGAWTLIQK